MIFRRAFSIPVPGLIFSAIGLVYSILMSAGLGAQFVCLTSGCALVEDFRVAGFSPWWLAALFFGLMTAFSVFRLRAPAYFFACLLLLGDCLFLLAMIFIAPCTSCLIAAILIFCAWVSLRMRPGRLVMPRRIMAGGISVLWGLLFLLNLGPALAEFAGPKVMGGNPEAKVSVYFSPTCPACLEAVRFFAMTAVFYPVAENEDDIAIVADLEARMASGQGLGDALLEIEGLRGADKYSPPELNLWDKLRLRFSLMRNQARISRLGFQSVPVIMIEGMPRNWVGHGAGQEPEQEEGREAAQAAGAANDPGGFPQADGPETPAAPQAAPQVVPQTAPETRKNSPAESGQTPGSAGFDLPSELSGGTMECGPETQKPCD